MLRVFYSPNKGFKFAEVGTDLDKELLNEDEGCEFCSTNCNDEQTVIDSNTKEVNIFVFHYVEGIRINIVDNYDTFKKECLEYYNYDTLIETRNNNVIDVTIDDISDLGTFQYYQNIKID